MSPDPPLTEDDNADTDLPADSGAALRDAVEAAEEADLREGEGKDEHL